MWPFNKPEVVDTTEAIFLNEAGTVYLPLQGDNDALDKAIYTIEDILRKWMIQDLTTTSENNQPIESSLLHNLKEIDLKYLPFPTQRDTLKLCMEDNEINRSGSRLMDAIVTIEMLVPVEITALIKGKFLYAQLFGIQRVINGITLPDKNAWVELLKELPWAPYLVFIQKLFDEDDIVKKISELGVAKQNKDVTVVPVPDVPTPSAPLS